MALLNTQYTLTSGQQITGTGAWVQLTGTQTGNLTASTPYLVIASLEASQNSQHLVAVRVTHGGTVFTGSQHFVMNDDGPDVNAVYNFAKIYTPSSSEALAIEAQAWTDTHTVDFYRVSLIAIPLAHVSLNTDYFTATNTTPINISDGGADDHATLTFTPPTTGHDWLIIGHGVVKCDSNTARYTGKINWSGGVTSSDPTITKEGNTTGGWETMPFHFWGVRTLTNVSHTLTWNFDMNIAGLGLEEIQYSHIYAIDLDTTFESFAFEYNPGADILTLSSSAFGTEAATAALTPTTAADVLVIGGWIYDATASVQGVTARLQVDQSDLRSGTTTNAFNVGYTQDNAELHGNYLVGIHQSATAALHTYDLDIGNPLSAGAGALNDTCMVAISLVSVPTGAGPTAGTNPTFADVPTESEIPLSWGDSPDNTETYLHRDASPGFTPGVGTRLTGDLGANATSYTDTGLEAEAQWYYVVEWLDGTGSTYSAELSAKTAPAKPVDIVIDSATSTRIDFTVTPGTGAADNLHKVWVLKDGVPVNTIYLSIGIFTSFVDNLDPGSFYTLEAQSYILTINNGLGAYSTLYSEIPETAPGVPPAPTLTSVNDVQVVLALTGAAGADAHYIHRVASGAAAPTTSATRTSSNIGASPTSYTDNTVAAETAYDYYVEAENTGGTTFSTAWLDVTTAPARPTGLSVTTVGVNTLAVQLVIASGSGDNTHYLLYRVNGSGSAYTTIPLSAGQASYTIAGLSQLTTYEISAQAYNGTLISGQTTSITATTEEAATPEPPTPSPNLVAGALIDEAKKLAYPFLGPVMVSDSSLLALLSTLEDKIITQIFQIAPTIIQITGAPITCDPNDDGSNALGYTLQRAIGYGEFFHEDSVTMERIVIRLIPKMDQHDPAAHPSAVIIGNQVYPVDPLQLNWTQTELDRIYFKPLDKIYYSYIPLRATLTSRSSTLNSPDFCRAYLVNSLVTQILLMNNSDLSLAALQNAIRREDMLWNQLMLQIYMHSRIQSSIGGSGG